MNCQELRDRISLIEKKIKMNYQELRDQISLIDKKANERLIFLDRELSKVIQEREQQKTRLYDQYNQAVKEHVLKNYNLKIGQFVTTSRGKGRVTDIVSWGGVLQCGIKLSQSQNYKLYLPLNEINGLNDEESIWDEE